MLQGIRLLQPPKSCWFPLCLVCFDGKIKTKIKKALTCINQHRDFPTPYANQFYKLDIPSFQFQAISTTKYKSTQNKLQFKQHTIKITGPNNEVWIRLYQ
jgi:hypothetical protein